jgi:hypothetical protein
MTGRAKLPVVHEDTDELLGFVNEEPSGWSARTIFGYVIDRTVDQSAAEQIVRDNGREILKGTWRYYDDSEHDWFACILKEVYENRVVVIRTNELGFQERTSYKLVTLKDPDDSKLQKA